MEPKMEDHNTRIAKLEVTDGNERRVLGMVIDTIDQKFAVMGTRTDGLQDGLSNVGRDLSDLSKRVSLLGGRVEELGSEVGQLKQDFVDLRSELREIRKSLNGKA